MLKNPPKTISEYIQLFPSDVQIILKKLRQVISLAAPEAKEKISYGIPTFTFHGNLVHFGGFKHHISFYPTPSAIEAFKPELSNWVQSKGTIKFPLDQPIPYDLITKIVKFRVAQNSAL